ncbi:hypothetical protein CLAFUW4_06577 [Fulvia fulva]|uniref:Wax synthase domain-containing protein n=1 Tax=Passalora fulva TaxID=5499 RepID=A0A9Q8UQJ4_PASFU|nr:uncharacterized protein CLAFUR5_06722 [Fulvia fulva]KAK4621365.1 hypothetical protein CLAFUR4_06585 [Fulvia fulva]KAK4622455.1 hypothetical protein CLAFUR0_06580 [Fulvia fulva]UJO18818.1 hypothetical protein CLAFUR5_06722 [Fulvia fulva]WPV16144.1 hypothetical protein CLAFUW4_06577 [Fulvia fulva]WPV30795.1 hypothetical protein CLAFUW7_06576 [Fulvia fulva]
MVLPPGLKTAKEVRFYYEQIVYPPLISSGNYRPFVYPWAIAGFLVVLAYLLVDHRKSPTLQSLRFPLFGLLCAFSAWCVINNRGRSSAAAYGVGLLSGWGTLFTASIMFFNDCQTDFKRIERADAAALAKLNATRHKSISVNGSLSNGTIATAVSGPTQHDLDDADQLATQYASHRRGPLFWQSYPVQSFSERLDWMLDCFSNFRGVGWNFQTYGVPSPPLWVEAELRNTASKKETIARTSTMTVSKTGIRRYTDRNALLKDVLIRLALGFFALDLVKTLMHHDAYFWGYMDAAPPTWLPAYVQSSYILVKSYRLLLSLAGIWVALLEIFRLGPLFFCGILGPKVLGIRGEPWMSPMDFYGNFNAVLDNGIAGWWGTWWHQIFRFGFEAPTTSLLKLLGVDKKSQAGKLMSMFTAFVLSGGLHACGSHTQLGDTRPFLGPFRFFLLQPFGILAQTATSGLLKKAGIADKVPKSLRRLGNFLAVFAWMYFTAPLLVDDFAKGGVWLFEPLAISPLRVLGYGAKDDNGWDLWYGLVFWRKGKHWWDTGLAF